MSVNFFHVTVSLVLHHLWIRKTSFCCLLSFCDRIIKAALTMDFRRFDRPSRSVTFWQRSFWPGSFDVGRGMCRCFWVLPKTLSLISLSRVSEKASTYHTWNVWHVTLSFRWGKAVVTLGSRRGVTSWCQRHRRHQLENRVYIAFYNLPTVVLPPDGVLIICSQIWTYLWFKHKS